MQLSEPVLLDLPVPVIIDHLGRATDTVSAHYRTVRKLLDSGRGWVKVSGAYLYGKDGPPGYADSSSAARDYIAAAPERCVWGSDWPHPDAKTSPGAGRTMPDRSVEGCLNLAGEMGRARRDAAPPVLVERSARSPFHRLLRSQRRTATCWSPGGGR